MAVVYFRDDDCGYLRWVEHNTTGFVVNCYRNPSPGYLKLHSASCGSIQSAKQTNYTTRDYMKVCNLERHELERWAAQEVGGTLDPCQLCRP